jgi:predicted aspartyl protease/Flp pilus assembly protein TadD
MRRTCLVAALSAALVVPLILAAQAPQPATGEIELQLGDLLAGEARFRDAVDPYRRAVAAAGEDVVLRRRAQAGLALALLRMGDFAAARTEAQRLVAADAGNASALALFADTLWASGLFEEAELAYDNALKADAGEARAHHGRARTLTARSRLDAALIEAQEALRLAPREAEYHHDVGVIYERQHRFEEAAAAFGNYVNLLPNKDRSDKAAWTRAEIRFLDAFKGRTAVEFVGDQTTWTVPIRIEKDKVLVNVKVNGARASEFVLDTGAEQIVVSREMARRRGILPITYMQSAGVGDIGLRGLQVGRLDALEVGEMKVHNVPCLIKNPPLNELPSREPESFSPLALGLSMRVDYARRQLVMSRSLPEARYATELPLRLYRLATVRGIVNGNPASFVVDTGGEVISISQSTAGQLTIPDTQRRIPLKVYGTSGWDKEAFLLPNVDLEFNSIRFSKIPVVVLNLNAPSALLGYQLGGIVGHKFLSRYTVTIDLNRSVVGLETN